MFFDYKSQVVAHYYKKKAANNIAQRLIDPTPAKLKDECLAVCKERFDNSDENTLRTFFTQAVNQKGYLLAIDNCSTDKFKPLVNFLKGKTNDTEDKNIELLAWLIDFTPRPFELGRKYDKAKEGRPEIEEESINEETQPSYETSVQEASGDSIASDLQEEGTLADVGAVVPDSPKPGGHLPHKSGYWIKIIALLITVGILLFVATNRFRPKTNPQPIYASSGHDSCMFWAGDHFQQISCGQKLGDTLVIAMDIARLNQFKRIMQPDTITSGAIGKVWYVKVKGDIEFYTADGYHPQHPELRLHPVTQYIFNKYIKNGKTQE